MKDGGSDTGTLRGDILALLRQANGTRIGLATVLTTQLASYSSETGTSLSDLREAIPGTHVSATEKVMQRGVQRGEIDPAKLTPRIARLPVDLFRQEILMTLRPLPDDAITEIVDTIVLPLVTP